MWVSINTFIRKPKPIPIAIPISINVICSSLLRFSYLIFSIMLPNVSCSYIDSEPSLCLVPFVTDSSTKAIWLDVRLVIPKLI